MPHRLGASRLRTNICWAKRELAPFVFQVLNQSALSIRQLEAAAIRRRCSYVSFRCSGMGLYASTLPEWMDRDRLPRDPNRHVLDISIRIFIHENLYKGCSTNANLLDLRTGHIRSIRELSIRLDPSGLRGRERASWVHNPICLCECTHVLLRKILLVRTSSSRLVNPAFGTNRVEMASMANTNFN